MLPAISPAVISHLAMPNSGVRRYAPALQSLVSAGARDRLARAEEPVVRGLCAGGSRIRTLSPPPREEGPTSSRCSTFPALPFREGPRVRIRLPPARSLCELTFGSASAWVESAGLDSSAYGTHSIGRTKVAQIYKKTRNLRAVQLHQTPKHGHGNSASRSMA